ncbi:MAG: hypothetical protein EPO64_09985 [Nitrospirae bacterium]|nr:MAG: hypothetical protein EPO64_09985 [Nitrospirota bacterium]
MSNRAGGGAGIPAAASALFCVALFAFLYWNYPFDGMIISDSWYWYLYDAGEFRWPTSVRGDGDWKPQPYTPDWTALVTRRGLMPVMVMLIDHLVIGDKRVFLNLVCLLVLAANVALFGYIVWRIVGAQRLYPIMFAAMLFPFAAGSHFWQHLVLNNLAVTFFLASLALFLRVLLAEPFTYRGINGLTIGLSLGCYWTSILIVDYAIFMSPLYLYLALCRADGGGALLSRIRFANARSAVAMAYVGLTGLAVVLFSKDAPTVLAYSGKLAELASKVDSPTTLIAPVAAVGHAVLYYLSAAIFNSVGLILQPAVQLWRDGAVLFESAWVAPAVLLLAGSATVLWFLAHHDRAPAPGPASREAPTGSPMVFGLLWAVLAYLPFASSFGYPRVVGLTADRINILALWGVAVVAGVLGHRLFVSRCCGTIARASAFAVGVFLISAILISNLFIQKEYYVEVYKKERQLALLILENRLTPPSDGHKPVVILDRARKLVYPREKLMTAVSQPQVIEKALGLLGFVVDRFFLDEYVTSSYHLNGIMMFGCCPGAAPSTIFGYAKLYGLDYVPVYTIDKTFRFGEDPERYRLGYEYSNILSHRQGEVNWVDYPKQDYDLQVIEIGESFFRLRGSLEYSTRATVEIS